MERTRLGTVSVVVVNYRGAEDTIECLRRLRDLDWPANHLQVVVVDNASGDDSVPRIRSAAPEVTLIESAENTGFAGGCNLGVAHATGEFVAFINSDARPDAGWLTEAVRVLQRDAKVACVASKVLDWAGDQVDFVDAAMTWYGMGYKPGAGMPYDGGHETECDVLFATGSAMIVRADVYRDVDGFDERYFMFYEDVDLGWRLNLLGYRVRYVPSSLVYHKHHGSISKFGEYRERFLLERNALMTLYKNLGDDALQRVLAPAMALAVRRGLTLGELNPSEFDLQRNQSGDADLGIRVAKQALTGALGLDSFVDHLPGLAETRGGLQARRVVPDHQLLPLMRRLMEPALPDPRYLAGYQALTEAFDVADAFATTTRVLIVTGDPIGNRMAGPAIRACHIAGELSGDCEVRLVSLSAADLADPRFTCVRRDLVELRDDVEWADVVVIQGFVLYRAPWLADTDRVIVVDLYDPMHVEQLEQTVGGEPMRRARDVDSTTEVLNRQLERGDFFLTASEEQRTFWLGQLAAVGRINPYTYDDDSTLRSLVAVAPFGLPDEPPETREPAIKGVIPGIARDDKVIIWAGGIYEWFDPLTLIRAMAVLAERHPDAKLLFMGTRHPSGEVPEMNMPARARALARELGLLDKFVFFNDGWVDYARRADYLLDADLGVSTHRTNLETALSFRTRVLDYLWAGLPMVLTAGDTFAALTEREGLGAVVADGDVDGLADALERCLYDEAFRARCRAEVRRVAERFAWSRTLAPLVEFCRRPRRAADAVGETTVAEPAARRRWRLRLGHDLQLVRHYLAEGGPSLVVRRAADRGRRMLSRSSAAGRSAQIGSRHSAR